jgi:uncharacterized membrane protein YfcA
MPEQLAIGLIFVISGFTMSFAGFGFAMVSVPLLALLLPIREAVALQFPYCLLLFFYQAWHYRAHFSWRLLRPVVLGTFMGLTIGTFMLYNLPDVVLKRTLGVFIAIVVVLNALPNGWALAARYAQSPWWGRFCGFLSGSFAGAYTIGGPQAALYIMSVTDDPREAKSFLAIFFSAQLVPITIVYAAGGMFSWEVFKGTLAYSPAVAAGSTMGFWAFAKASNRLYRYVVLVMLLFTAVALWWRT